MRRNIILKDDKTTSGGFVIEGDWSMLNAGRPLSYQGARVYCPNCKETGFIVNVAPFSEMLTMTGKQVALEGDLCACACKPAPKLIASRNDMFMTLDADELARMGYAPNGERLPPAVKSNFIAFKVGDAGSLLGLPCIAHFDDGSTVRGYFDQQNTVRFDSPPGKACKRLSLALDEGRRSGTFSSAFVSTFAA
ncbi:PAAR domain-containing protein [Burkholderia ubonensis]|uniref:PAAR domain-containing protein n=1 Tax=Burkholderia ubonensis TaxID=101571 RepID=UPI0007C63E33|nr:PAAR domain-containing protein [Burkholderia ubonensis]